MARTPQDSVAAFLRKTALPQAIKAEAWDAFQAAESPEDLTPRLKHLPLPQTVRANLWDLKARSRSEREIRRNPRRSPYGMGGQMAFRANPPKEQAATGAVSSFIRENFRRFNAATLHDAAEAYVAHLAEGGQMLVSLGGAMSTAELGRTLAPMIRQKKVHAISCTGANLEEDLFLLIGRDDYESVPDYQDLAPTDEAQMFEQQLNRVTDVAIPATAMTPVELAVKTRLDQAVKNNESLFPHEILYDILRADTLAKQYQADPKNSWLVAAAELNLPIIIGGWGDSTLGNVFAADCLAGTYEPSLIHGDIEYMVEFARWYMKVSADHDLGFFQISGGISGDFPICCVPLLEQDAHIKTKKWTYFAQISDATTSYGGYSGAAPREKITWGKLKPDAPMFSIDSDATIVAPLIFAYVLGW